METAGTEPQVLVLATTEKGDVTWAPFAGAVTVMADAATVDAIKSKAEMKGIFIVVPRGDLIYARTFVQSSTLVRPLEAAEPRLWLFETSPSVAPDNLRAETGICS